MSSDDERKVLCLNECVQVMWGLVLYLLITVLLHAAVDVTEPSSRQHVWRLLVDESVKMSLDLQNVEKQIKIHRETVIWIILVANGGPARSW